MAPLLQVKGLKTQFFTQDGIVHAVDGISYDVEEGETLGIVGESGCGKSVGVLSVMRLIPTPPGKIVAGEVLFQGRDMLKMSEEEVRQIRGNQMAMIFQDPMTSLNPTMKIGKQIVEGLVKHRNMNRGEATAKAIEMLDLVAVPQPPVTTQR